MEAGRAEQQRVYVAERVPRVEPLVVHYGRGDDLLPQAEVLAAETLDEVGEEDVDLVEVLGRLEGGQISLAAQFDLLFVQQPLLVVAGLPEVARHLLRPVVTTVSEPISRLYYSPHQADPRKRCLDES